MKASASFSTDNGILSIKFDIFEAIWGYLLFDNIGIMADSKNNRLNLFSFLTGKEQASVNVSQEVIEKLANAKNYILNFALGDEKTAIYKNEGGVDVTGKLMSAIEAQFAGKNATAIECYKAVLEANPYLYRVHGLLGRCLRADENTDNGKAKECYLKAIELAPWSPEAYCNMGVLFQKNGEEENAQTYFVKAIEADNYYCNALIKRATYLMEKSPESYELRLINLRLSSVYNDISGAQNHIKAYMAKMGYDRISYSDKETALFGDYGDAKLHQKLKKIESYIINGAFQAGIEAINEVLLSTKDTSAEKKVAGWCHSRSIRIKNRIDEEAQKNLWAQVNKLIEKTPEEENLYTEAEGVEAVAEEESVSSVDPVKAEEVSKIAISAIENEVSKDGDYKQPVAGPVAKEFTEVEKNEALAEAQFIENAVDAPAPFVESANVEDAYATESPAPAPSVEYANLENAYINDAPPPVLVETVENASGSEVSKDECKKPVAAPLKDINPITIQEFFMLILFEIMRDGEIEEQERKFLAKLKDVLSISDTDFTKMFNNVKNQVKASGIEQGVNGKFDMKRAYRNLCKAAWRDGVLQESEKKILVFVSKIFKLAPDEAKKMILEGRK